ncbi:MAG: hypothetical protein ACJ0FR_04910 [Gammaproteobacteria bacterium]|tara:strand:+ start:404 stop:814 length:411 start_codon:yes stop_codon:yes gene_type:complete
MPKKLLYVPLIFLISFAQTKEERATTVIEKGQIWSLEAQSNKLSIGNSKVLYFFPNDAYNTYRARKFSDWDSFSIIDGRNLVRLNKGDRVEILQSKFQSNVYEVKLMDGYEKNRKYFLIKEDLLDDFKLLEHDNQT